MPGLRQSFIGCMFPGVKADLLSTNRTLTRLKQLTILLAILSAFYAVAHAQTDCAEGNGGLDMTPPKDMTVQELTQKFLSGEDKVQAARSQYQFTEDVLVRTLDGTAVTGQFHQIANVSYDHGKRVENVSFSEQSTLRDISMSAQDMNDVRVFMQWILTSAEAAQYNLTYAGQQHVDDLDTYVFHVVPKKEEKNKRYFQGRVWVDRRDLQVVKLCGKSVPDRVRKKNQPVDIRPTFAGYRQIVDGNWFPVYARVDDTLQFGTGSVHVREIVKFKDYKRADVSRAASRP